MKIARRRPRPKPRTGAPPGTVSILAAILACVLSVTATASGQTDKRNPRQYFFAQTFGDLREELELARSENRVGMLLFFEMDGCPYCLAMLRDVFSDRTVQDWFGEHFVSVAIDVRGDVEFTDFDGISAPSKFLAAQREIAATPVITFTNLSGGEIYRHRGLVRSPEELLLIGRYVAEGYYDSIEFRTWALGQGAEFPEQSPGTRVGEQ